LKSDTKYIESLIAQGEHEHLDFKYNISDSRKIARSMVAFANSGGGILLIGVRDNGSIAGIRSDEEIFMIEAAANMYSKPEIIPEVQEWKMADKTILEVIIHESKAKPHYAQNEEDKWLAYVRFHDKNILANGIMIEVWKRKQGEKGTYIRYLKEEKLLLNYLELNDRITFNEYCRLGEIPYKKARMILINLISLDVLKINVDEKQISYSLK
jgi:predicted HTH transcriptional regulator